MSQALQQAQAPVRLPGLDGLRAIAALAVVVYHLELGVLRAGFLGVDLFFTISGFIITALLVREHADTARVDLRGFYLRRARRLVPPTLAVLVAAAVLGPLLAPDGAARTREDLPAALAYLSNWWQIHAQQSYFEGFGSPPVLQHLWSLAVEEQYYLLWPALAWLVLRRFGPRVLGVLALLGALASTGWMAALHAALPEGADPSRLYLGTDTHAMGLLLGSALACLWNPWKAQALHSTPGHSTPDDPAAATAPSAAVAAPAAPPRSSSLLAGADMATLWAGGGLLAMMVLMHAGVAGLYQGGFLLASALSAALIVAGMQPGSRVQRLLEAPVMTWLGTRSFAIYLWHWPAVAWIRPESTHAWELASVTLARLAMTLACAELSYRLVETPLRRARGAASVPPAQLRALLAGCLVGVAGVATLHLGPLPRAPLDATREALQARVLPWTDPPVVIAGSVLEPGRRVPARARALRHAAPSTGPLAAQVTVIGDSVMLGAREVLRTAIPGLEVDAEVGRQGADAPGIVRRLREGGALGDHVVLHLGTNGYFPERHLREVLRELADRRTVVLVNAFARRDWTGPNNALFDRVSREHANVRLVDWQDLASRHPDYLVRDGVHLTVPGMRALSQAITAVVRP